MIKQVIRTPMQLAMVLNGQRKELELSQKEAAEKVGLLPKTISVLENDPERSKIESLFKLLSSLDIELVLQPKKDANSSPEW